MFGCCTTIVLNSISFLESKSSTGEPEFLFKLEVEGGGQLKRHFKLDQQKVDK